MRGLIVDYGGVLDRSRVDGLQALANAVGPPATAERVRAVLAASAGDLRRTRTGELTLGELAGRVGDRVRAEFGVFLPTDWPRRFAAALAATDSLEPAIAALRARSVAVGLLSNTSPHIEYRRHNWDRLFDVVHLSAETGRHKPDPEAYRACLRDLGVGAAETVFVDDDPGNVTAAAALGLTTILHRDVATTAAALERAFGRPDPERGPAC